MNIANFINTYTNIYTYIICNKNDSKTKKWFDKLNTAEAHKNEHIKMSLSFLFRFIRSNEGLEI